MRSSRKTNFIFAASLLIIVAAFAGYATLVMRWLSKSGAGTAATRDSVLGAQEELRVARRAFRTRFLDPRAHLRLSEALWSAGRPVDAFYVSHAARQLFSDTDFRRAHAEIVLGAGGPAAAIRARLKGLSDPALSVPIHAQTAREYPDSPEGRDSLEQLSRMAVGNENVPGGDASHMARIALDELYRLDPKNPEKFVALAGAAFWRGDTAQAAALASEAWNKHPGHAGAAHVLGMLAVKSGDIEEAIRWLTAAWDRNPYDLYSAAKLAQIYDKRRADPEGALPFYLVLYRQNPDYADGETAEQRIRETLDARREKLLADAPVEGLGERFKSDDASLRAEACLRAAAYKDPRWIDALGNLLDDDTEIVRRNADYALFEIAQKDPDAVRARRDQWLESDKPLVRIRALNLFADLDGMNAFPRVLEALKDQTPAVRGLAKVMVLDHYYHGVPQADKARTHYLSVEKDPDALALARRFPVKGNR